MTNYSRDKSWFLGQLKPNSAQIAHRNLRRQGFETFLPMEEVFQHRKGQYISTFRPVFPGYIFVSFDPGRGLWRKVQSTQGITSLVSFGMTPAAVPFDIVEELMQRCDAEGKLQPPGQLTSGDQVRLTTGPFASFVATIEKVESDRRVWLLMEFMGARTRVAVTADQLRPA